MTKETCNKENMLKFIAYLESGKFKQGRLRLRPTNRTYCCLGVAEKCRMDNKGEGPKRWKRIDGKLGIGIPIPNFMSAETYNLSRYGKIWLGVNESDPQLLIPESLRMKAIDRMVDPTTARATTLNDALSFTFAEIAKCFRHTYIEDVE